MKNTLLITYSKHSDTFANRKYEELSYPKNQIMCDPILVTLLKMRPHYSHSSRENATPSSGTSSLASYEEVPPPPPPFPTQNKSGRVLDICIIISALKDTVLKHSMTAFATYSKEFLHAQPKMTPLWVKILLSVLNTPGDIKICNFYP